MMPGMMPGMAPDAGHASDIFQRPCHDGLVSPWFNVKREGDGLKHLEAVESWIVDWSLARRPSCPSLETAHRRHSLSFARSHPSRKNQAGAL